MIFNRFNPTAEDTGIDYGMFSDLVPAGASPVSGPVYSTAVQPTSAEVFASKGPLVVNPDGSTTYTFDDSGMAPTSVQTAVPTTTATAPLGTSGSYVAPYPTSAELSALSSAGPLRQYQMMRRLQAQYGRNWNIAGPGQGVAPGIPTIQQLLPGNPEFGTQTGVYNPSVPVTPTAPIGGTPAGIDPVTGQPIVPTTPTTRATTVTPTANAAAFSAGR